MNDITLTQVFFAITAAAVIVITVLLAIGIIYLITIFRTMKRVVRTAEFATEVVKEDLVELRQNIKSQGFNLGTLLEFFGSVGRKRVFPKKKK